MTTKYICANCGEYEDKIIPIREQKTESNLKTTEEGIQFDFRHKVCGGKATIYDNGVPRSEFNSQITR